MTEHKITPSLSSYIAKVFDTANAFNRAARATTILGQHTDPCVRELASDIADWLNSNKPPEGIEANAVERVEIQIKGGFFSVPGVGRLGRIVERGDCNHLERDGGFALRVDAGVFGPSFGVLDTLGVRNSRLILLEPGLVLLLGLREIVFVEAPPEP